jgi:hypothetical protein
VHETAVAPSSAQVKAPGSLALMLRVSEVAAVGFSAGDAESVITGAVVSTVQEWLTEGPGTPAGLSALIEKVCGPSASTLKDAGLSQEAAAAPSSEQRNSLASVDEKAIVIVLLPMVAPAGEIAPKVTCAEVMTRHW